jgi:hypothetical protein
MYKYHNHIIIAIITLLFLKLDVTRQYIHNSQTSDFKIQISIGTGEELRLECVKGCAWMELKINCISKMCSTSINEFGMVSNSRQRIVQNNKASFQIELAVEANNYSMKCMRGCSWTALAATSRNSSSVIVTQDGVSGNR